MHPIINNIGSFFISLICGAFYALAAGSGDATAVTGSTVDRKGFGSAKLSLGYSTTLTEAATLTFAVEYQESDDDSSWDTAVVIQAATLQETGGSGGSTNKGCWTYDIDLTGMKRYVRFNFTPNLSAGSTDVAKGALVCNLGGAAELPATANT